MFFKYYIITYKNNIILLYIKIINFINIVYINRIYKFLKSI